MKGVFKANFCKSPSSSLCIEGTSRKIVRQTLASPIVVVPKSDNTVRICGDYMATINQTVEDKPYVLPTTQDLSASLVGSKVFSKLDLSTHTHS